MDKERFQYLYTKYLQDNCSENELKEFYELYHSLEDPQHLLDLETFEENFPLEKKLSTEKTSAILTQIQQPVAIKQSAKIFTFLRIAAALLFIGFAALWFMKSNENSEVDYFRYSNTSNKIKVLTLEDGTRILLKPNSELVQKSDFAKASERIISFKGEGFFDVSKRSDQPFKIVSQNQAEIKVYGTRFNLIFQGDQQEAVLTEGSIAMKLGTEEVKIKPSERVLIDKGAIRTSLVDTMQYISWTNHQLYFNNKSLQEVINQLHTAYPDQKIQINNQNSNLYFTGYLPTDDFEDCITILQKTFKNYNLVISIEK